MRPRPVATAPASTPGAGSPAAAASAPSTGPVVPEPDEVKHLTHVTQLTRGFDRAGEGYFSADMKWIVFQATPVGEKEYQMFVAPLDLATEPPSIGSPVRITPPNSRNTCGFFSPDGSTLIFASTAGKEKADEPSAGYQRSGNNYRWAFPEGMEIYAAHGWQDLIQSAHVAASSVAPKPSLASVDLAKPEWRLTDNDAYDAEGAFSPDGKWIVFTSRRGGDTDIWVMRADGSHPVQLTTTPGYDGGPFFSPDGRRIVYRSDRKGNDLLQVFTSDLSFDAEGNITGMTNERQLTDDGNVNWGPYFHPDGDHIIFATSIHGHQNYELYRMRSDGSDKTRITYCAGFDALPVFSPDGRYLMWSSKRTADNTTQLFLAQYQAE